MTTRTALVTDSTANFPAELAAERHIYVAPLYILWGEECYKDGVNINAEEFYDRLAVSEELPKTSQVSLQDFVSLFQTAHDSEKADEIVCAVISSELSGTYASAVQAREVVDFPVHIIDTYQTSWALGHAVLSGAEARDRGASPAEIVQVIEQTAARQRLIFTIESLEFLHRGGRIGHARLLLGSALHVKPILFLGDDGIVASAGSARTRKRAAAHLLEVAREHASNNPIGRLVVIHGGAEDEANQLAEYANEALSPQTVSVSYVTPVLGTHVGPKSLGLIVEWLPEHS